MAVEMSSLRLAPQNGPPTAQFISESGGARFPELGSPKWIDIAHCICCNAEKQDIAQLCRTAFPSQHSFPGEIEPRLCFRWAASATCKLVGRLFILSLLRAGATGAPADVQGARMGNRIPARLCPRLRGTRTMTQPRITAVCRAAHAEHSPLFTVSLGSHFRGNR